MSKLFLTISLFAFFACNEDDVVTAPVDNTPKCDITYFHLQMFSRYYDPLWAERGLNDPNVPKYYMRGDCNKCFTVEDEKLFKHADYTTFFVCNE